MGQSEAQGKPRTKKAPPKRGKAHLPQEENVIFYPPQRLRLGHRALRMLP